MAENAESDDKGFIAVMALRDKAAADGRARPEQIQAAFDDGLVEIVIVGAVAQADSTRIALRDRSSGTTTRSLG